MPTTALANNNISLEINGALVSIAPGDQQPLIINGRTYVPLRVISENLGASIEWRPVSRMIIINTPGSVNLQVSDIPAVNKDIGIAVDGKVINIHPHLGKAFITQTGRTVVPLRAVGEALGCQVNWNNNSKKVEIRKDLWLPGPTAHQEEVIRADESPAPSKLLAELAKYRSNLRLLDKSVINSQELLTRSESSFSPEQMEQFQSFYNQLAKYQHQIQIPNGKNIQMAELTIFGPSIATSTQLKSWIAAETPRLRAKMEQQLNRQFVPIPDLADLYLRIGAEYGIRGDLAFCQAAKETHFWQFTGDVKPYQNNYCGLGATGNPCTGLENLNGSDPGLVWFEPGVHGAVFANPEVGVEAHIQHLYAYASKDPLPPGKVLVDPRYTLVRRGSSTTWVDLNARWAVPGLTYGQSIIQDYWLNALQKPLY